MTASVALKSVRKDFGTFTALSEVTFDIADNEFFTLLGPSGCGKTTLLRMIAGFEDTTAGTIHLYGDQIGDLPPNKRPVNTVFQNYALFPHMNVAENIGFSLKMLGWGRAEIRSRVDEMVEMVQLRAFVHRKPSQMSGGQQQRVALARAMAPRPKVLLLDEPLSALDLKLRQEMRAELKRLQRDTGITFIFVTHDQEEALSMSDRIAVMSAGQVQQIGTPNQVYEHPANRFVADFIGETNLIAATVEGTVESTLVDMEDSGAESRRESGTAAAGGVTVTCRLDDGAQLQALANRRVSAGTGGVISLRPERLTISKTAPAGQSLQATLGEAVYLGTDTQYRVQLAGDLSLKVRMQNGLSQTPEFQPDDPVFVSIADGAARFLVD